MESEETFHAYLLNMFDPLTATPIAYVIRETAVVAPGALNEAYDSIDERSIYDLCAHWARVRCVQPGSLCATKWSTIV